MGKHGTEDWGVRAPKSTVYGGIDLAEHAARTGSVVSLDRRGDVLMVEDFEDGIERLKITTSGLGASVDWSAERVFRGGFSCKFTAGSNALRYAEGKAILPFPTLSKLGFEAVGTMDDEAEKMESYIDLYTGAQLLSFAYKYVVATKTFSVLTPGGIWAAVIVGVEPYRDSYNFGMGKVVIDPTTLKYTRLIAGPYEIDLSAYYCSYSANLALARMEARYKYFSQVAENSVSYLDSAILTQNEP